jgi:hypothetical protein
MMFCTPCTAMHGGFVRDGQTKSGFCRSERYVSLRRSPLSLAETGAVVTTTTKNQSCPAASRPLGRKSSTARAASTSTTHRLAHQAPPTS